MRTETSIEPLRIKTMDELEQMKRITTAEYFNAVVNAARTDGHLEPLDGIIDYILPSDYTASIINEYKFDTLFIANFGGSEGIYIDASIKGKFNFYVKDAWTKIGTIKTLRADLDAMKIMGEACGILTFYADAYTNRKLDLFTPDDELRKTVEWRMNREAGRT